MLIKNKCCVMLKYAKKDILLPFVVCFGIVFLLAKIYDLRSFKFIDQHEVWIYATLTLLGIQIIKPHISIKIKKIFIEYSQTLFISGLLVFIGQKIIPWLNIDFLKNYPDLLIFTLILTGGISLYSSMKEKNSEKNANKNRNTFYLLVLFATFIFFIGLKIGLPFIFSGSYIDEYTHIFSALELIKNGHFAEIYDGEFYRRGAAFSYILATTFKIFGANILHAKLLVAGIGIINFFLLFKIARISLQKTSTIILLLIYSISPWIIFEHFYIRFYILYESCILLTALLAIHLTDSLKKNDWKSIVKLLLAIVSINALSFLFIRDAGRFMIVFYTSLILSYVYIFQLKNVSVSNKLLQKLVTLKKYQKIGIISSIYALGCVAVLLLIKFGYLPFDLSSVTYSTPDDLKYSNYFFNLNFLLTLFFIFSIFINRERCPQILYPTCIILMINLFLPASIQNTRSILYVLPLFYLISTMGIERYISHKNHLHRIITLIAIGASIYSGYPKNFLQHPYLPKEVDYMDNKIYADAKEDCKNHKIIVASNPGTSLFFGIQPDYYLNTKLNDSEWLATNPDSRLFRMKDEIYSDVYSKTPIITNAHDLESFYLAHEKICLIQGGLPYSWLDGDTRSFIKENFTETDNYYSSSEDYKRMRLYTKPSN